MSTPSGSISHWFSRPSLIARTCRMISSWSRSSRTSPDSTPGPEPGAQHLATDVEVPDEVLAGRVVLLGRLGTKHMREAHQSVALHVLGDGRVPGVQDVQPGEGAITGPGPLTAAVAFLEHGQQQSRLGGEVVQDPLLRHLDRAADRGQ